MLKTTLLLAASTVAFSLPALAHAQEGEWTFHYFDLEDRVLQPLDNRQVLRDGLVRTNGMPFRDGWLSVTYNTGPALQDAAGITYPEMEEGRSPFVLHPGPGDMDMVFATFEPATPGMYQINVDFTLIDATGTSDGVRYSVGLGQTTESGAYSTIEMFAQDELLTGYGQTSQTISQQVTLEAGQVVGIVVNNNGSYLNDSTLVNAAIEPAEASAKDMLAQADSIFPLAGEFVFEPGVAYGSPSGDHFLVFQTDGNLVIYTTDEQPIWALNSRTHRWRENGRAVFQADGNLATYAANGGYIWSALHTPSPAGTQLTVTDDGELHIVAPSGDVLWNGANPAQ